MVRCGSSGHCIERHNGNEVEVPGVARRAKLLLGRVLARFELGRSLALPTRVAGAAQASDGVDCVLRFL